MKRLSPIWPILILLSLGVAMSFALPDNRGELEISRQRTVALLALVAGAATFFIAPLHDKVLGLAERVGRPKHPWRVAVGVGVLSLVYLFVTAKMQGRYMDLSIHDEFMHSLQTRMLAGGHLWLPQHPVADFFEAFHIFVKPVYASMYFPGTSILYLPWAWFDLPSYVMPLLVSAATVMMLYRVATELLDGFAGLLAALTLVSLRMFRSLSTMVISNPPMALMGLVLVWAYLCWRRQKHWGWALVMGFVAGWAAITRPGDAVIWAVPVTVGVLWDLRRSRPATWALTICLGVLAAAPFLALQIYFNANVSGDWREPPFNALQRRDAPGARFSESADAHDGKLQTTLQQKLDFNQHFVGPMIRAFQTRSKFDTWRRYKLPIFFDNALPVPMLSPLLALSVLAIAKRRWVVWCILPMFFLIYAQFPAMLAQYAIGVAPAVVIALLMAIESLRALLTNVGRRAYAGGAVLIGVAAVLSLPQWQSGLPQREPGPYDDLRLFKLMNQVNHVLPAQIGDYAVLLITYRSSKSAYHEEPVYNVSTAWPDDAKIIKAQDLGVRNIEIFRYYGEHQPDRKFYQFDRLSWKLTYLGTAAELARGKPAPESR